ncbi:MAG: hypothetical protein WCC48_13640 [Anaeromyxobacteraceae bacterium]
MGQPVKLSDHLMLEARRVAEESQRSLAGQIEHWARLGRAIDTVMRPVTALKLKRRAPAPAPAISARLEDIDTPAGRARVAAGLTSEPFPHFEVAPGRPGLLVRIDEDGRHTIGRFVKRKFVPVKAQ